MSSIAQSLQEAVSAHQTGDLPRAEAIYREIVRVDPQHADALHLLGLAAHERNHHQSAVDYISRAIKLNDQFAPYYSNLGVSCMRLENKEEAIRCFQRALELDPEFADAYFNLGTLHFGLNNWEKAQDCYERGLQLNSDDELAWQNLGMIHESLHRPLKAMECYREVCRINPGSLEAMQDLTRVEMKENAPEGLSIPPMSPVALPKVDAAPTPFVATVPAEEIISAPAGAGEFCRLAKELTATGRLEQASVMFREAIRLDENHADSLIGLGRTLKKIQASLPQSISSGFQNQAVLSVQKSHFTAEEVLDHMVQAIEGTTTIQAPFPHVYYRDIFPPEFYQQMLEHLPETALYEQLMHHDAMLPNGESARRTFDLAPAEIAKLPEISRQFWTAYASIFKSPRLVSAIFSRFTAPPRTVILAKLYRDLAGYKILPHPDIAEKQVTTQFYLPRDLSRPHLGTCLYEKESVSEDNYHKVKQFQYAPNSGYSFEVSETSWHGVEETQIVDGPRDSLMIIFYDPDKMPKDY